MFWKEREREREHKPSWIKDIIPAQRMEGRRTWRRKSARGILLLLLHNVPRTDKQGSKPRNSFVSRSSRGQRVITGDEWIGGEVLTELQPQMNLEGATHLSHCCCCCVVVVFFSLDDVLMPLRASLRVCLALLFLTLPERSLIGPSLPSRCCSCCTPHVQLMNVSLNKKKKEERNGCSRSMLMSCRACSFFLCCTCVSYIFFSCSFYFSFRVSLCIDSRPYVIIDRAQSRTSHTPPRAPLKRITNYELRDSIFFCFRSFFLLLCISSWNIYAYIYINREKFGSRKKKFYWKAFSARASALSSLPLRWWILFFSSVNSDL